MNASQLVRRLHEHRRWVNRRLLEAAESLTPAGLRQEFPIGQGSVWKTLTHLMGAEYVWLEALLGNETPLLPGDAPGKLPGNQQGEEPLQSLDELTARWRELEIRWEEYLAAMNEATLEETVYKVSSLSGRRLGTRRVDILLHVCTHAQYTTAQLVNMLRQLGAGDLPDVMLTTMARQRDSK